jgi:hypothetical protein
MCVYSSRVFLFFFSFSEGGHIRPQTCKQTALAEVNFTSMVAAFGTRKPQKWSDHQLLESHPILRVGGLRGTEVTVTVNGQMQVIRLEQEWTFGRKQRQRPWFRCPVCDRRCRTLHEKDCTFLVCRLCSGYDYRSRHRNSHLPAANRVRRVAGLPRRALAREALIAQVEISRLLRATIRDLERRAKRGKR